jgi:hypothetical protein
MKPLSKKAKLVVSWTALMTVVGTAVLHQWQFFALGCISIVLILIGNHYNLLNDPTDKK